MALKQNEKEQNSSDSDPGMQESREKISKLSKDIKTSQKLLDRARTKRIGILRGELKPHHVRMSFILGNKDTDDNKSSSQVEN